MAQDSLPFKEAASLATKTALNVLEISTNAPAASQDTQSTPKPEDVLLKLDAPMVKNSSKVPALKFVIPVTSSMKVSVSMEDASMDTLPTTSEVAFDQPHQLPQDLAAMLTNTSKTNNVLDHAQEAPILTPSPDNVFPAQPIASPVLVPHSV